MKFYKPYHFSNLLFTSVHTEQTKLFLLFASYSDAVFLHGGPTYAYYYVEVKVYSGKAGGLFSIDVLDENREPLKFAEFRKTDHGRGAIS